MTKDIDDLVRITFPLSQECYTKMVDMYLNIPPPDCDRCDLQLCNYCHIKKSIDQNQQCLKCLSYIKNTCILTLGKNVSDTSMCNTTYNFAKRLLWAI